MTICRRGFPNKTINEVNITIVEYPIITRANNNGWFAEINENVN